MHGGVAPGIAQFADERRGILDEWKNALSVDKLVIGWPSRVGKRVRVKVGYQAEDQYCLSVLANEEVQVLREEEGTRQYAFPLYTYVRKDAAGEEGYIPSHVVTSRG